MVSFAEMERMMKVQEVISKAMAGSLKRWEAAGIIGITDRTGGGGRHAHADWRTAFCRSRKAAGGIR